VGVAPTKPTSRARGLLDLRAEVGEAPKTVSINSVGQNVNVTFAGNIGQNITLSQSSAMGRGATTTMKSPDGNQLGGDACAHDRWREH
jgi:hypothetical protein